MCKEQSLLDMFVFGGCPGKTKACAHIYGSHKSTVFFAFRGLAQNPRLGFFRERESKNGEINGGFDMEKLSLLQCHSRARARSPR